LSCSSFFKITPISRCNQEQIRCQSITNCHSCSSTASCKWVQCGNNFLEQGNSTFFMINNFTTILFTAQQEIIKEIHQLNKLLHSDSSEPSTTEIEEIEIGSLHIFFITSDVSVFSLSAFSQSKCSSRISQLSKGCTVNSHCTAQGNTLSKKGASIGASVAVSGAVTGVGACFVLTFVLICYRRKKLQPTDVKQFESAEAEGKGVRHQSGRETEIVSQFPIRFEEGGLSGRFQPKSSSSSSNSFWLCSAKKSRSSPA